MASFDIITAAGNAYTKVWEERAYLLKLLWIPVLIKLTCYVAALALGYDDNIIRLTLILVPAFFAEGWVLAHFARLIYLGQRWPFKPTGDEKKDLLRLEDRARGIMSGIITYVLINILLGGYLALLMYMMPAELLEQADPDPQDFPAYLGIFAVFSLILSFWGFRFIWLYIPMAVNYPLIDFLKRIAGVGTSFYMIAVWLVCFIPAIVILQFFSVLFLSPFSAENMPEAVQFILVALRVILDSIKNLLCTAGIAYGLKEIFQKLEDKSRKP